MAIAALLDSDISTELARRVTRLLRARLGDELVVVPVDADADVTAAAQRVLELLHPRAVIAVGGDTMISAVAAALVDMPAALGVVPLDPAARLAKQLGVPTELDAACGAVADGCASGHPTRIDALAVGERIVLSRTVMGRLADLDAPEPGRSVLDRVRWGLRSLAQLFGPTARYHIDIDGHPLGMRASSVVVANSGAVGVASLQWAPQIAIDDGIADVVVIRSSTLLDYVFLVASWCLGRERRRQAIHVRAKSRIEIRCSRTVPVTHDGARERTKQVSIRVVRGGLQILLPPRCAAVEPPTDTPAAIPPLHIASMRAS